MRVEAGRLKVEAGRLNVEAGCLKGDVDIEGCKLNVAAENGAAETGHAMCLEFVNRRREVRVISLPLYMLSSNSFPNSINL